MIKSLFLSEKPKSRFVSGLSRRGFLTTLLVAPVIIRTAGLLMPVSTAAEESKSFRPWFTGLTPLLPPEREDHAAVGLGVGESYACLTGMDPMNGGQEAFTAIDDFLMRVHDAILVDNGKMPDIAVFRDHPAMVFLA